MCSVFGALNGNLLVGSRVLYAMAQDDSPRCESNAVKAVALLARAKTAGLIKDASQIVHLKQDNGLDALRGRPDFAKLLTELEAGK